MLRINRRALPRRADFEILRLVIPILLLLAACGDPGTFIWAENGTNADLLIRFNEANGARVYSLPAAAGGYLGTFSPQGPGSSLEILDLNCVGIGDRVQTPELGAVVVRVVTGAITVTPTNVPETFDGPRLETVQLCGSVAPAISNPVP